MGRKRDEKNKSLPVGVAKKGENFYHVSNGVPRIWTKLGKDIDFSTVNVEELVLQIQKKKSEQLEIVHYKKSVARKLLYNARNGARMRNLECSLTIDDALLLIDRSLGRCAVSGIVFETDKSTCRVRPYYPSIDRIDSSKGYTIENVRLVCTAVNFAMNQWGLSVLDRVATEYVKLKKSASKNAHQKQL